MANPITYQPAQTLTWKSVQGPGSASDIRWTWSRQKRPYDLPARYHRRTLSVISAASYGLSYTNCDVTTARNGEQPHPEAYSNRPLYSNTIAEAVNQAREDFLSGIRSDALLAVNWVERQQSIDMLTKRVGQLYRFSHALRRGDLSRAALELGLLETQHSYKRKRRWRTSKQLSNQFLEFHFGWEPLVKDIYTCVNLLQSPVYWPSYEGKGSGSTTWSQLQNLGGTVYDYRVNIRCRAVVGATVRVSNPNLWLANQLGLINPAAVAWELVPWSFVVDWFINVGDFLNQYTDTLGLEFINPYTTYVCKATGVQTITYLPTKIGNTCTSAGVWIDRSLGIPGVTLKRRQSKRLSLVRAATAVSLLVQKLPSRGAS